MGPVLTYSSMLCTVHNSPLATSVTGNIKDIATTILGAVLFPGFTATVKSVLGLLVTFVGAGVYSYVNLKKAMSAHKGGASGVAAPPSAGAGPGVGAAASKAAEVSDGLSDAVADEGIDAELDAAEDARLLSGSSSSGTASARRQSLQVPVLSTAAAGTPGSTGSAGPASPGAEGAGVGAAAAAASKSVKGA
jgi:hypothetical protein